MLIMKFTIREIIESMLPAFLSKRVVFLGKLFKKAARKSRRFLYGMGKPFIKSIEVFGVSFKVVLDPFKNAGIDEDIARDGFWEKDLSEQFMRRIKKGDIFLDIGANIGYYSLFAASFLDGTGKVYSFEPLPELCEQMHRSIEENNFSNIEVFNLGLSDKEGEREIYIRDENIGGSSLSQLSNLTSVKIFGAKKIKVKKLDLLLNNNLGVDIIKIDVEGHEYEALKGAASVLKKNHPLIFMEFSPVFYVRDYAEKPYELILFLRNLGYSFFTLDGKDLDLETWLYDGDNINSQINIICKM